MHVLRVVAVAELQTVQNILEIIEDLRAKGEGLPDVPDGCGNVDCRCKCLPVEILVTRYKVTADDGEIGHIGAFFVALAASPASHGPQRTSRATSATAATMSAAPTKKSRRAGCRRLENRAPSGPPISAASSNGS